MYQRVGKAAYKADLSNTHKLAAHLDHPERGLKCVHVAGTNGKGSTSHMLASVLQEAGYKVGLYTSPHLKDFRERIKINGKMISKRSVSAFVNRHKVFFEAQQLSFFEMTVGLAFDTFRREKVDIAIIEVGMGGRLDSTNIVSPEVSVITNIGLDHTQFLGTTLAEIAAEKAGIIKPGIPVVIGETLPETKSVFIRFAEKNRAPLIWAENEETVSYPSDLKGSYQKMNQCTAISVLEVLRGNGWKISETHIKKGMLRIVANTGLLGRWQVLRQAPKVICDTAHNKEGLALAMQQLQLENYGQLHLVLGVVSDKDLNSIVPLFPKDALYYFCEPQIPRAMEVGRLVEYANGHQLKGSAFKTVKSAYKEALKSAKTNDLIYVGGSTFVVAEVL